MNYIPDNPVIVQGDLTVLVEALHARYAEARDALLPRGHFGLLRHAAGHSS